MKYKVGQLVLNRKLGLGKVLEINGNEVLTYFKDELTNPRTINVSVVPMEIAAEQSDPFFDGLSARDIQRLRKPSKRRRIVAPPAPGAASPPDAQ
ncbi:hypothetical protein [Fontivita pretiosa]|uniref:hypothetical protein n=1 Tax=Fontivita pretiosa TaxID=2989684 RepID=UPI003D18229E